MTVLLDTHVVVRWLSEPKRVSADQLRAIRNALRYGEQLGVSAAALLEIAVFGRREERLRVPAHEILAALDGNPDFQIIPLDLQVAIEIEAMGDMLGDLGDRAMVASERVHRLRLVTSDQRIIQSKLVPVLE